MFWVPKNGSYNFKSSKPRWVFVGAFKNVKKFHATMCMRNLANMWIMYIFNIFFWHSHENGAVPKKEVLRELERGREREKGNNTTVGQQELNEVKEWSQNCIGWLVLEMLKLIMLSRKCICRTMTVRPQPQKIRIVQNHHLRYLETEQKDTKCEKRDSTNWENAATTTDAFIKMDKLQHRMTRTTDDTHATR